MQYKRFTKTVLWGLLSALCLWLPGAWAQTHRLDDVLEAYERGHYRQALELARQAGQAGNARALELAGSMQWHGSRLYGSQVPGDRAEATRLFRAAVALDRDGQLNAARFYLALAGRAKAANLSAQLGYSQVYSVLDGFEGDLSPDGQRTVNGWKNAGLPWSYKLDKTRLHDTQ